VVARLRARARELRRRVVLPEVTDPRTTAARRIVEAEGLAEVVWVEQPERDSRFGAVAAHILERRKHKGVDAAAAQRLAAHPLWFAASLVALGHADASVGGAAHATADVLRAGIQCVGTAPGVAVVSSMFLMVRGDTVLSYADCGVVPEPSSLELASIAAATARNHVLFTGETPRVAFLSFSTKGSAEHPRVDKVREALAAFREQHPEIAADGELQLDAALVPDVARRKAPGSAVAGRANVLVFPDLDSGNLVYKATERLAGFGAFGPLVQGLAKPCLDLSRGCSAEDMAQVVAMAAVMTG
jgi:phosphate acetyltransferase